jgi:hypothetical protein
MQPRNFVMLHPREGVRQWRRVGFIAPACFARAVGMIRLSRRVSQPMLVNMLSYPGPMSNTERQRRFRKRNPGYFNRYKRKPDKAAIQQTLLAALTAAEKAEAEKAHATREPLALPAPVVTTEIPGMNMVPPMRELSPLPVSVLGKATILPFATKSIAA